MTRQQLLFLLIFFGFSVGSWVIGRLREQAKIRHAREMARRQYEEQLRTGRQSEPVATQPPQPVMTQRQSDLAERRQAQLRELRQQQERGRGTTVLVGRGPMPGQPQTIPPGGFPQAPQRTVPTPPRPAPVVIARPRASAQGPGAQQRVQPPTARQPNQQARQAAREMAPAEPIQRERPRPEPAPPIAAPSRDPDSRLRGGASAHSHARALLFGAPTGAPSVESLRRLIIAGEVLGKPLSLREA